MGQVWRGVHTASDTPVAIKVLPPHSLVDAGRRRAFEAEVGAAARLDHAHVVRLLDYGVVSGSASEGVQPGSPFFVMEWANGGSLKPSIGQALAWPDLRRLLASLLRALGHAHARGIVHRDLKPDNMLLFRNGGPLTVKLGDFGIAWLGAEENCQEPSGPIGTYAYMAPEQIQGDQHELGPWTDLYGLGCVAWELATGCRVFPGVGVLGTLAAHMAEYPAAFRPISPVPVEFDAWLRALLIKNPRERCRSAPDALRALLAMDPPPVASTPTPSRRSTLGDAPTQKHEFCCGSDARAIPRDERAMHIDPCPVPAEMPRPRHAGGWFLPGVGEGLYDLRLPRLVGRREEAAVIHGALQEAVDAGEPRVILLYGARGSGRSFLARRVAEALYEAAGVRLLRGRSTRDGSAIVSALISHFRVGGLGPGEVRERLVDGGDGVDRDERVLLAETLVPSTIGESMSQHARLATMKRAVQDIARRPTLLQLDDVHADPSSLKVALRAQRAGRGALLVVMTVDTRSVGAYAAPLLRELEALETTVRIDLEPLDDAALRDLVTTLVGLSPSLAKLVSEQTCGDPLFAVRLVGHWIANGLLTTTSEGFELDRRTTLPRSLSALMLDRLEQVLGQRPPADRVALEIAALMGEEVDFDMWVEATGRLDVDLAEDLVGVVVRAGLAKSSASGMRFADPALSAALRASAAAAERLARHHLALAASVVGQTPRANERRGRHLFEGGDYLGCIGPLMRAVDGLNRTDAATARVLLDLIWEAAMAADISESDRAWARVLGGTAWHHFHNGPPSAARQAADELAGRAHRFGWVEHQPEAIFCQAMIADAGKHEREAIRLHAAVMDHPEATPVLRARSMIGTGKLLGWAGLPERATELLSEGIGLLEGTENEVALLDAERSLAGALVQIDGDAGVARFQALRERCIDLGAVWLAPLIENDLAEHYRQVGDFDAARACLARGLKGFDQIDAPLRVMGLLNLGLVELADNRREEARKVFQRTLEQATLDGTPTWGAVARLNLATLAAGDGDWATFEEHFPVVRRVFEAKRLMQADLATDFERAGRACADNGRAQYAEECLAIAQDIWDSIERSDDVDRVAELRAALS